MNEHQKKLAKHLLQKVGPGNFFTADLIPYDLIIDNETHFWLETLCGIVCEKIGTSAGPFGETFFVYDDPIEVARAWLEIRK